MDRDQNNDVMNTRDRRRQPATKYRAHQASACPTAMMPLSTDWTALNAKIDAMTPTGNTNVTIGLQMAWQTLVDRAPFNAPAPSPDLDKVIILLTDGDNTQNRWIDAANPRSMRAREKACDQRQGRQYQALHGPRDRRQRTCSRTARPSRTCISTCSRQSQLNSVFSSIAQNLANLRIAK